jgi:hypothetical protein
MTVLNNMPTDHAEWTAIKKSCVLEPKIINSLNRFQYRYRLACSFSSMTVDGTTALTCKGYTAFMKLFLAYSAYDEVRAAEKILLKRKKLKIHNIKNEQLLAASLRKNIKLKNLLIASVEDEDDGLKESLNLFYEGTTDNVMCIATAARNIFVHGVLTAGGAGLSINARVTAIEELAYVLRKYCNKIFSKCINRIKLKI